MSQLLSLIKWFSPIIQSSMAIFHYKFFFIEINLCKSWKWHCQNRLCNSQNTSPRWDLQNLSLKAFLKSKSLNLVLNVNFMTLNYLKVGTFFHIHWMHYKLEGITNFSFCKKPSIWCNFNHVLDKIQTITCSTWPTYTPSVGALY
jgi:hypothetical protein